jgi:hypothetical protein
LRDFHDFSIHSADFIHRFNLFSPSSCTFLCLTELPLEMSSLGTFSGLSTGDRGFASPGPSPTPEDATTTGPVFDVSLERAESVIQLVHVLGSLSKDQVRHFGAMGAFSSCLTYRTPNT